MTRSQIQIGLIIILILVLINGFLVYYVLKLQDEKSFVSANSNTVNVELSNLVPTDPIPQNLANEAIKNLRKSSNFQMDTDISWNVDRIAFDSILAQNSGNVDGIQFYPALNDEGKLTIILVGRYKDSLILGSKAEIWDYIKPCPPYDCPKNHKVLVE